MQQAITVSFVSVVAEFDLLNCLMAIHPPSALVNVPSHVRGDMGGFGVSSSFSGQI
jgi:hypothetical protein